MLTSKPSLYVPALFFNFPASRVVKIQRYKQHFLFKEMTENNYYVILTTDFEFLMKTTIEYGALTMAPGLRESV